MMTINRFPLQLKRKCFLLPQNCYSGNYLKERLQHLHKDSEGLTPIIGKLLKLKISLRSQLSQLISFRIQFSSQQLKSRLLKSHRAKY